MKKLFVVVSILVFWPQPKSNAHEDNKTTIKTLIDYQYVKYEILFYQIGKKSEEAEIRIDSIKNNN